MSDTERPNHHSPPPKLPLLIVVTGPPATGKTTIARELAHQLGLPVLEKDAIKEVLFESLGSGDRERSRQVGAAAFAVLFNSATRLLGAGTSFVLEANFAAETAEPELARLPKHRFVQVFLSAPPATILDRFRVRASATERHPGHADIAAIPEVERGLALGRWRALSLHGELIERDTSSRVDIPAPADLIRPRLG